MLAEAMTWLFTPATGVARRMGHLTETIAIVARHRRCRDAWAPHLAACRTAILKSARAAPSRRRALVLGSGPLLDIPLDELANLFEEVCLVDIVHPWSSRLQARRHTNVRLIEQDVTESLAHMPDTPPVPTRFLDDDTIDWVASVNLLSQLPRLPEHWLRKHCPNLGETALARYGEHLMRHHLIWLEQFSAPVCLLCDIEQIVLDASNARVEVRDYRPLLNSWDVQTEWRWDLAPKGELDNGRSAFHRVAALYRDGQQKNQHDIG